MADNQQPPKSAVYDSRFKLASERKGDGPPLFLQPTMYQGKPGFSIYDNTNGNIYINFDIVFVGELMQAIRDVAQQDQRMMKRWDMKQYRKPAGGGKNQISLVATLMVGRGEDGICYIGVKGAESQRPLKFPFQSHFLYPRVDMDGNTLTDADVSAGIAVGWANTLEQTMINIHNRDYVHPVRGDNGKSNRRGGNNNGGGYNNNSYGGGNKQGGGANNASANEDFDFDFDI